MISFGGRKTTEGKCLPHCIGSGTHDTYMTSLGCYHHLAKTVFATLHCTLQFLAALQISHKVLPTLKGGRIKLYLLERGESLYHLKFFQKEELSLLLYLFSR